MKAVNIIGRAYATAQWLTIGLAVSFSLPWAQCQTTAPGSSNQVQLADAGAVAKELPLGSAVTGFGSQLNASIAKDMSAGDSKALLMAKTSHEQSGPRNVYLRARLGRGFSGNLSFRFTVPAGSFGEKLTPSVVFPVSIRSYSTRYEIQNDGTYPSVSELSFSGPAGSGLNATPATQHLVSQGEDYARYESPETSDPATPPAGLWKIFYKNSGLNYILPNPQTGSRLTIPVPTVIVSNDVLETITWKYIDPATGSVSKQVPPHLTRIDLNIQGLTVTGRLYDSDWLLPHLTQHVLSSVVYWSSVGKLEIAYTDTLGNEYVVVFQK